MRCEHCNNYITWAEHKDGGERAFVSVRDVYESDLGEADEYAALQMLRTDKALFVLHAEICPFHDDLMMILAAERDDAPEDQP